MPIIAFVATKHFGNRVLAALAIVVFVLAVPFVFGNFLRSLAPGDEANILRRARSDLYFSDQHFDEAELFKTVVESLAGSPCRDIAILPHVWEPAAEQRASPKSLYVYPLLALLSEQDPSRHFEYVGITNSTARLSSPDRFDPCVVICLDCIGASDIPAAYDGWASRDFGFIRVLKPPKA